MFVRLAAPRPYRICPTADRIGVGRIRVLLPFAKLERVLDHHPAALEAAHHEFLQCNGHGMLRLQKPSENNRILDGNSGARRHVRSGRMRRIADEKHAPAVPRREAAGAM